MGQTESLPQIRAALEESHAGQRVFETIAWRSILAAIVAAVFISWYNAAALAYPGRQGPAAGSAKPGPAERAPNLEDATGDIGGTLVSPLALSDENNVYFQVQLRNNPDHTILEAWDWRRRLLWKCPTGSGRFFQPPAVGPDGTICVSSSEGIVTALTPEGHLRWQFLTGSPVHENPAMRLDGTLYVGCENGNLYAIRLSGQLAWKRPMGSPVTGACFVDPYGVVYAGSADGMLTALNPDGALRWKIKLGGSLWAPPLVHFPDRVVYALASNRRLAIISADGTLTVSMMAGSPAHRSPFLRYNGAIYVTQENGSVSVYSQAGLLVKNYDRDTPGIEDEERMMIGANGGASDVAENDLFGAWVDKKGRLFTGIRGFH